MSKQLRVVAMSVVAGVALLAVGLYIYTAAGHCVAVRKVVDDPEAVLRAGSYVRTDLEAYVEGEKIGQCVGEDEEFSALLQAGVLLAKQGDMSIYRRLVATDLAGSKMDEVASVIAKEYNSGDKVAPDLLVAIPSSYVVPIGEFKIERVLGPDANPRLIAATIATFSPEQLRSRKAVLESLLHRPGINDRIKAAVRSILMEKAEVEG